MFKFIITNTIAMEIAQEVVREHAPRILEKLGLAQDNDGILDRISVVDELPTEDLPHSATFNMEVLQKGFMGFGGMKYERGTGTIKLRALAAFHPLNKKGKSMHLWPARLWFFKDKIRRHYIFLLAHELKHYHQYWTGEIWEHRIGSVNFMPYEWRWEEKDANQFAYSYLSNL